MKVATVSLLGPSIWCGRNGCYFYFYFFGKGICKVLLTNKNCKRRKNRAITRIAEEGKTEHKRWREIILDVFHALVAYSI